MAPLTEPEDAITASEMGKAEPAPPLKNKRPNAFAELMAPKPKQAKSAIAPKIPTGRDGLAVYTEAPDTFPPSRVLYHNDDFVVINDLYPKATVHLLILPRNPKLQMLHPFEALADETFLASVKKEVVRAKEIVASELKRRFGKESASSKAYEDALNKKLSSADDDDEPLPDGRDWFAEVKDGIHSHPSMNHLHIHVLSRDMHSDCLRHKKHYNSFNTKFLVPVDAFPLSEDDERRHPGREGYLKKDMVCWKCGQDFHNKFAQLKEHLEDEFKSWKAE